MAIRASDTLVGGPPTIGSLPSKRRLHGKGAGCWIRWIGRCGFRGAGRAGAAGGITLHHPAGAAVAGGVWVDGGYVETDDGDGGDPWGRMLS